MRKIWKKCALLCSAVLFSICVLPACREEDEKSAKGVRSVKLPEVVQECGDYVNLDDFAAQTLTNDATVDGIIVSPYYQVTYTDGEVYSYAVPSNSGEIHSFGYIEATEDMFPLQITITVSYALENAVVIPEKLGVTPEVEGHKVTFTVDKFDYYTVLFNGKYNFERPYTLFVREYEDVEIPDGYKVIEYGPGLHYVDTIPMKESNTFVYLHSGAFLVCRQPSEYSEKWVYDTHGQRAWNALMYSTGTENLKIGGYGVIDMSGLTWHARSPINFTTCNNISIEGITIINSPSWSIYLTDCKDIYINNVIMLGYRTNSDGSVLCNCKDALVENCFFRSGDDLFEVKATKTSADNSGTGGENITYRRCQAWADKTRSFGFIQESQMDVKNILFEDCSSLYQQATFDDAMGAFLVVVGDNSTVSNVTFKNCDSYYCIGSVLNICVETNQWTTDQQGGCVGTLHDIKVENFKYYSEYIDSTGQTVKNRGIRLVNNRTNPTAEHFYNVSLNNLICDGRAVGAWSDIQYVQKGPYKNVTLNGIAL